MVNYDIIILGSGPGGYVTAIRASQLGLKTAIVEKESLGGVCLNWGCIPTKALLKSAQVFEYLKHSSDYGLNITEFSKDFNAVVDRSRNVAEGMSKGVTFLMKKNKIDVIKGYGKLKPGKVVDVDGVQYSAEHIIISTGARSRELPSIPQDGKKIIGYRQAMTLKKQPKSMIIVGSGAIGVEFAYFYNSMGTKVTVVEYLPNIVPVEDKDISKELEKSFKKSGINVMTSSEVLSVDTSGKGVSAKVKTSKGEENISADIILSAVGIKTNIENIGLEEVGIAIDRDKILVDKYDGNVPSDLPALESLPGVGHKTASVVISQGFGQPAFPVDTHIHRLAQRWGLTGGKNVQVTERDLKNIFPRASWNKLHLQIIFYGRQYCTARGCDGRVCEICTTCYPNRKSAFKALKA